MEADCQVSLSNHTKSLRGIPCRIPYTNCYEFFFKNSIQNEEQKILFRNQVILLSFKDIRSKKSNNRKVVGKNLFNLLVTIHLWTFYSLPLDISDCFWCQLNSGIPRHFHNSLIFISVMLTQQAPTCTRNPRIILLEFAALFNVDSLILLNLSKQILRSSASSVLKYSSPKFMPMYDKLLCTRVEVVLGSGSDQSYLAIWSLGSHWRRDSDDSYFATLFNRWACFLRFCLAVLVKPNGTLWNTCDAIEVNEMAL